MNMSYTECSRSLQLYGTELNLNSSTLHIATYVNCREVENLVRNVDGSVTGKVAESDDAVSFISAKRKKIAGNELTVRLSQRSNHNSSSSSGKYVDFTVNVFIFNDRMSV